MRLTALLLAALLPAAAFAQQTPLTIEQVMADADWIGPPVERPAWVWDSQHVQYQLKRDGSLVRDAYVQALDGSDARRVMDVDRYLLEGTAPAFDAARTRMAFVRNGDIFIRDLRNGALTQITRSEAMDTQPAFTLDGRVLWRTGNDWWLWSATDGVMQASAVKAAKDPAAPPKPDALREQQLRTLDTLARDRAQREEMRQQNETWQRTDFSRAPMPVYLGDEVEIVDSALSPNTRWLLVVTQQKGANAGQSGKMPKYITESGYEEFQETRTRVGRNAPLPQRLWLVDVAEAKASELKFDGLPGISDDPLAALRKQAGKEALKGNRDVRIETDGDGNGPAIHWNADGTQVAVLLRAVDNKDRWLASVDFANAKLIARHRLTDAAWINWSFNNFGWLPGGNTLWFLSEQDGYSHLYTQGGNDKPRALTSGKWEVSQPEINASGDAFLFLCNRNWPGKYEICTVGANGGQVRELTSLNGVGDFSLSPDGKQLLVSYSKSYLPAQLAVVPVQGGEARLLTDTRTAAFKAREWIEPEMVQVPSQHGAGVIWGKYYGPKNPEAGRQYPIVMFVHGAGYLQNVIAGYPSYFREQMFHNLLVQRGYIVLDLDYRGSAGYGRDWRTAIYRNMGHPELEDYLDGLDWLAANKQGDKDHAGIYGGSYGGFMTFMALFRAPGKFKAGAALRPVVDWMQYNHEYTSNILNTPELDPEAYRISSPIEYAAGLQDHLLIAHGMIDDNVFFKDSVSMTQKLIELHKDNWQIAPYPLERHGFTRADSWLDEYKRILKLFEDNLKSDQSK